MDKASKIILAANAGLLAIGASLAAVGYLDVIKSQPQSTNEEWMSRLYDSTELSQILIPGSHDSGARYSIAELSGRCQDLEILPQLEIGVRFLDIRLQLANDSLKVIHGVVDQKLTFEKVTSSISTFLEEHPSETIFVSVKEEKESKGSNLSFEEALEKAIDERWLTSDTLPSNLGESRGKAILLSRYEGNTIGIDCYDGWLDPDEASSSNSFTLGDELYVQDHYKVRSIEEKQEEIGDSLQYSLSSSKLCLNFLSGYLTSSFPPTYAPSIATTINPWIQEKVRENDGYSGILIADYVTSEFASSLIERNFL